MKRILILLLIFREKSHSLVLMCIICSAKKMSGGHGLNPRSLRSQKSIFWHVLVPWPVAVPMPDSGCGARLKSGKWKHSYAGASHRCPVPPPTHIASCSVWVPLWHCPEGALHRPAGGPITSEKYVSGGTRGVWIEQAVPDFWLFWEDVIKQAHMAYS